MLSGPPHTPRYTKALETLIGLGKKRSRAQAVEVLRSLKDMFAQGVFKGPHNEFALFQATRERVFLIPPPTGALECCDEP
jgi:hypothetical protein